MIKSLLRFFVSLDNLCYKIISKLVVIENNGVHPKHDIMKYHTFFIDNVSREDSVIDIGCGNGLVACDVADQAKKIVGIDMNDDNIKKALEICKKDNVEFIVGNVLTYNFDTKFDKIIFSNVLEHIEERVDFLKKLHTISDVILLRIPMLDRDWLSVYKKQKNLEYRLDRTHYIEYTMDTLRDELKKSGWKIKKYSIQFGEFWGVLNNSSETDV